MYIEVPANTSRLYVRLQSRIVEVGGQMYIMNNNTYIVIMGIHQLDVISDSISGEIIKFGEPEMTIASFFRISLSAKKTLRKPVCLTKECLQIS